MLPRLLIGPIATLLVLAALFLVHDDLIAIPNPAVVYLCAVVFSA